MALEKPPLPHVEPGRPVTAQGWNAIVDGAAVRSTTPSSPSAPAGWRSPSRPTGEPVPGATVVAEPDGGGPPVAALPLFGTATTYLVTGVSDGAWQVHVSAPGFRPRWSTPPSRRRRR